MTRLRKAGGSKERESRGPSKDKEKTKLDGKPGELLSNKVDKEVVVGVIWIRTFGLSIVHHEGNPVGSGPLRRLVIAATNPEPVHNLDLGKGSELPAGTRPTTHFTRSDRRASIIYNRIVDHVYIHIASATSDLSDRCLATSSDGTTTRLAIPQIATNAFVRYVASVSAKAAEQF